MEGAWDDNDFQVPSQEKAEEQGFTEKRYVGKEEGGYGKIIGGLGKE